MSAGRICENCDALLRVNHHGEDENGESSAWIVLNAGGHTWEACSRSCATELLVDGSALAQTVDAQLEVISEIARTIREARENDE